MTTQGKIRDMRTIILFLLALMLAGGQMTYAQRGERPERQQRDERKEAIEARRISYITRKLSLSPEDAKVFWPIYNEYTRKIDEISERYSEMRDAMPDPEDMTEEEAARYIEAEVKRFEESAALRREYTDKLLEAVSVKQVALLFHAERGFNRMLFREAQRRHRQDSGGRE